MRLAITRTAAVGRKLRKSESDPSQAMSALGRNRSASASPSQREHWRANLAVTALAYFEGSWPSMARHLGEAFFVVFFAGDDAIGARFTLTVSSTPIAACVLRKRAAKCISGRCLCRVDCRFASDAVNKAGCDCCVRKLGYVAA